MQDSKTDAKTCDMPGQFQHDIVYLVASRCDVSECEPWPFSGVKLFLGGDLVLRSVIY
jgi:hypothetical protein